MNIQDVINELNASNGEVSFELNKQCLLDGFVIVYGASDDLTEFNGAIDDEKGHDGGGKIYLSKDGSIINNDYVEEEKYIQSEIDNCKNVINAVWCKEVEGWKVSWIFETDIPHKTFRIMEDGNIYCIGIVFHISDLK